MCRKKCCYLAVKWKKQRIIEQWLKQKRGTKRCRCKSRNGPEKKIGRYGRATNAADTLALWRQQWLPTAQARHRHERIERSARFTDTAVAH